MRLKVAALIYLHKIITKISLNFAYDFIENQSHFSDNYIDGYVQQIVANG